jgi:oleate hydratase
MRRDPGSTQAWLIGSGVASLAAAVHLINDAKVPAANIHIFDVHTGAGGGIKSCGNAENGFVLYTRCLPYFHKCVEDLLSLVPSPKAPGKSIMDTIRDLERDELPHSQGTFNDAYLETRRLGPWFGISDLRGARHSDALT